eukprot:TRINITY_DN8371_c0_g2_i1.p1 TRINITY_DN8371_c0_g2~~TRINITY_DN8371_c0_g2_i1.p1  ORF type:complete len:545 (+),score=124.26 TRINITY_DN8371_c0_g2_i1:65-1699(+)
MLAKKVPLRQLRKQQPAGTCASMARASIGAACSQVAVRRVHAAASSRLAATDDKRRGFSSVVTPGTSPYNVAVAGGGVAAFYTVKYLLKGAEAAGRPIHIDMFERDPVPFGLARFGVAPDHPEVKNVVNDFAEVVDSTSNFRFFGNVAVGADLPLERLRRAYDATVICTGAQGERRLNIPGEDLQGVVGAPAFVKWYNGHPSHRSIDIGAAGPGASATVLGQGNVALDVARILVKSPGELHGTDIDGEALRTIGEWQRNGLQTVNVVGRRGFVQAAMANAELRELLTCSEEVLPIVDPAEMALCRNEASEEELKKNRAKTRSVKILDKMMENFAQRETTSKRIIHIRFLASPAEFLPDASGKAVAAVRLHRTQLQGEPGKQVAARCPSGAYEEVPSGLVVRSVGFEVTPLEGLTFASPGRVAHKGGRVSGCDAERGGLYVSGWVKRGPTGIIGSNIPDAQETAKAVFADLLAASERAPRSSSVEDLDALRQDCLQSSGKTPTDIVSWQDWKRLEAEELRRGAASGKAAEKFTDVKEVMQFLRNC